MIDMFNKSNASMITFLNDEHLNVLDFCGIVWDLCLSIINQYDIIYSKEFPSRRCQMEDMNF